MINNMLTAETADCIALEADDRVEDALALAASKENFCTRQLSFAEDARPLIVRNGKRSYL